ncbi:DUF1360 domain-containing protein [Paenibacillus sp. LHD-117]|uniref:DUF1360 domain-containing protein n=1 Tax=Paenibacillus sp. LHD-117 TaxID=3071412 RepID=UPI0027E09616|nr:DUF1360 domain-containing protein [Paenibacillus sp. LHD-117]MDQ6422900.1 DUF1360 domain-containing protein [Paenibacillus sp. LHD-117]
MSDISWLHFVILVLAAFRLTRLIVFDQITSFIRKPFMSITVEHKEDGSMVERIELPASGIRSWIGYLLSCYWCSGIWVSLLVVALYWLVPQSYPLLVALAVAGAAALIESKVSS